MVNPTHRFLRTQGIMLLVATTLIWGTTSPITKAAVGSLSPDVLTATRFAVAAIAFTPFAIRSLNARLVRDAALLGLLLFASVASQTIALKTISANRAAFIIGLDVILVPLFGPLLRQHVPARAFLAAGLAFTGIGLISWEGGALRVGDLWMFGCTLSYSIYILMLDAVTQHYPSMQLTAIQLLIVAALGTVWAIPDLLGQFGAISANFYALLYLGLVATAATTWIQAVAQRWVTIHETALIYTLEPVFAAVFSFLLLGETLGTRGILGAGLVLVGMVLSQNGR